MSKSPKQVIAPATGATKGNKAVERLASRVAVHSAVNAVNAAAEVIRAKGNGTVKGIRRSGPQVSDTSALLFAYISEASRYKTKAVGADGAAIGGDGVPCMTFLFPKGSDIAKASARNQLIELGAGVSLWFRLGKDFDDEPNVVTATEVDKAGNAWLVARVRAVYKRVPISGTVRLKCLTCAPGAKGVKKGSVAVVA